MNSGDAMKNKANRHNADYQCKAIMLFIMWLNQLKKKSLLTSRGDEVGLMQFCGRVQKYSTEAYSKHNDKH